MGKTIAACVVLTVGAVLGFGVLAQDEAKKDARPDVAAMTMDQLLEEFHHPQPEMMSCPAPQRWVDLINALRKLGQGGRGIEGAP